LRAGRVRWRVISPLALYTLNILLTRIFIILLPIAPPSPNLKETANPSTQIGALSILPRKRVQYSNNPLKFELEIKI